MSEGFNYYPYTTTNNQVEFRVRLYLPVQQPGLLEELMGLSHLQRGILAAGGETFFVKRQEISNLTGLSGETLKKYRLSGMLSEDVHWVRINSRLVLYNVPLVLDWLQNFNQPHIHEKAIAVYQAKASVKKMVRN
jgi:hypothetical protein